LGSDEGLDVVGDVRLDVVRFDVADVMGGVVYRHHRHQCHEGQGD
jgi:hypothetical protein